MKVLVTGADGFVGSRLVPTLVRQGHAVVAGVHPAAQDAGAGLVRAGAARIASLELPDRESVRSAVSEGFDAVVHLAALASGGDARKDPGAAWRINAEGTAVLAEGLTEVRPQGGDGPLLLLASTAEVYGAGPAAPRRETDDLAPCSPYGASKLGAEVAALEVHRRTGLRVVIARSFPHTGPGQDERYVVPALARRIRMAKRLSAPAVRVGNLNVTRELMHVDDVIDAYVRLLARGESGQVYNVASGRGVVLEDLFNMLCDIVGYRALPESHPSLMRTGDIPYLVGDAAKLGVATGWKPLRTLEQTLQEVADAQAD